LGVPREDGHGNRSPRLPSPGGFEHCRLVRNLNSVLCTGVSPTAKLSRSTFQSYLASTSPTDHFRGEAVVANIRDARVVEKPFHHLEFDRVFPDDVYAKMMSANLSVLVCNKKL
jgi:hypothetical protein